MIDKLISAKNLVPGKTYRVVFQDCCINGEFSGEFIQSSEKYVDDEKPDLYFVGFEIYDWNNNAVKIYEVEGAK